MDDPARQHDPARTPTIKEAYEIFASQINKEDQLIASRMSWGLTANGAIITLFGGLYAFLNSSYSLLEPVDRSVTTVACALAFFVIALEIYHQAIQAIWVARQQLYAIRKTYHRHWAAVFHDVHLPLPYGGREPQAAEGHREPSFFAFPTVVLRRWLPFAPLLHDRRLGPIRFVHLPLYKGDLKERSWFAEKILFAGLCMWIIVFAVISITALSPHPPRPASPVRDGPAPSRPT